MKAIYVFKNPYSKFVKIGVSINPKERLEIIKRKNGFELIPLYNTGLIKNFDHIEKSAHNKFKEYNVFGEWFDIDANDAIEYIKSLESIFENDANFSFISNDKYTQSVSRYIRFIDKEVEVFTEYILKDQFGCFYVKVKHEPLCKLIQFLNEKIAIDFVKENEIFCIQWEIKEVISINSGIIKV